MASESTNKMTPIPEHVPTPRSTPHYDTSGMHHPHDTTHAIGQIKTFLKPEEFKMLMADETGASLIDQFIAHSSGVFARNNTPESRAQNSAMKDDIVQYLEHLKTPVSEAKPVAGEMASESIPGFEDIAAPKTTSKAIDMDAVKAAMDKMVAEKGTTTSVSVGKPGDTIEGMEEAQAEVDAAASASSAPLESELKVDPADMDSLSEVGSSDFAADLTKYKQQLLEQEKKYKHSDWKKINDDFKKITTPEELAQHKSDVRYFLNNTKFKTTNKPESKKETAKGSNASGGTTDSNKSTPPKTTPESEKTPEKGKGFGVKGMAIGAGLAGVAGYLARGNSGGNSDNDKQLLDMVRGMNPQQLRQILQQIQR